MPDSREAAIAVATEAMTKDWMRTHEATPVARRMLREDVTRTLDAAHAAGHVLWADDWEQLDQPVHHEILQAQEQARAMASQRDAVLHEMTELVLLHDEEADRWLNAEGVLRERIGVLEAIVRDLAASEHITSPWTAEKHCRFRCGAYEGRSEEQVEQRPVVLLESHDPTCLWRRAQEVDQQEASSNG